MKRNRAYIDGQNLHLGARDGGWTVDYAKLRRYLKDKYHVDEAQYFLGYISEAERDLYTNLQRAGFILAFREHSSHAKGSKKGNVDSDIVFSVMQAIADQEDFDKVVLISGDGDYKKLVDFLIRKNRFEKVLFPNRQFASSLYKRLGGQYYDCLDKTEVRAKIASQKK